MAVSFDTESLARMVREMPEEALREGIRVNRDALLAEVFRRFPERLTAEAQREDAVIKWRIGGREDGGFDHWFVVLRDGTCEVGRDLELKPRVTLQVTPLDFLKVATGNANPVRMYLTRRLKVRGDLLFAARIQRLFKVPRVERA